MQRLASRLLLSSVFLGLIEAASPSNRKSVERGRYLVVEVGKCGDCHTPRLASGAPDQHKLMKGSVIGFEPLAPVPNWAGAAPDLTATSPLWKSWGEQAVKQFLVTGRTPNGKVAAPPMPTYTLSNEDARAIVDYLKSLY
jgi:mono/diheme cytochrome c family protein